MLRRQYNAINEMFEKGSDFACNDKEKCITCTKDVFDEWVRSHPFARALRHKPWMHYDSFVAIYGKDRANGAGAETATDVVEDLDNDNVDNNDEQMDIDVDVDLDVESAPPKDDVVDSTCQAAVASQSRVAVSSKRRKKEVGKATNWHATLGRFKTALAGT
ncbi:uncharacterized protein LOC116117259 [Pistacia vera]|uniref:uncharacterized protein LOC116117259 n=1 Tax=Pistacia vera TaxID=55513 RepID=UPI001262DBA9|nr:uncharacterized protein LOC116117259 [Pistacia vera]